MLFFDIAQKEKYLAVHPRLAAALDAAESFLANAPEEGRVEIDGDLVYANVPAPYLPSAAFGDFERHETYIDVQMVLFGEEYLDVADISAFEETEPYHADDDYALGTVASYSTVRLSRGAVAVLFPEDVHRPGRAVAQDGGKVQKIVLKVRV